MENRLWTIRPSLPGGESIWSALKESGGSTSTISHDAVLQNRPVFRLIILPKMEKLGSAGCGHGIHACYRHGRPNHLTFKSIPDLPCLNGRRIKNGVFKRNVGRAREGLSHVLTTMIKTRDGGWSPCYHRTCAVRNKREISNRWMLKRRVRHQPFPRDLKSQ